MDHGVEARLPFDAESVTEFAATLAERADDVGVIDNV
jgi:cytochrome c556